MAVLPEGFLHVKEVEQVEVLRFPRIEGIDESKAICIELLDQILNEAVGVHFLTAIVETQTTLKVRPILNKPKIPTSQQFEI